MLDYLSMWWHSKRRVGTLWRLSRVLLTNGQTAACSAQRDTAAEAMLITATADARQEIVLHVTFRPLPLPARSHFSLLAVRSQSVAGAAK